MIAAAEPRMSRAIARAVKGVPVPPDALAARLGKAGLWKAFLRVRSVRWRSRAHAAAVWAASRRPDLTLTRNDVVVLDARAASQRAVATICDAARRACATLIVINDPADAAACTHRVARRTHDR